MTDLRIVPEEEPDEPERPTPLALRYYASELKRHREAAGLTQAQLADQIPYSKSMVSMIETAKRSPLDAREGDPVTSKFTEYCDEVLNTGGALGRILPLLENANEVYKSWFRPYANLEAEAVVIYSYEAQTVPGIFQTESYARAVLASGRPFMGDGEVDRQTTARMRRQQILFRDDPPTIFAVLEESVLRRPVGGRAVLKEQIARLVELALSPFVTMGVMPIEVTEHAGLDGSWCILDFADDDSLLYVEAGGAATMSTQAQDVRPMRQAFDVLCMQSMTPGASIDLLDTIAGEL
ncbi:helix-turn-helix transcriptional regulator [Nocardiopsis sp. YSL2]|uniref:helix-turn-helix domain-containing protein n=1 Tax=Nocardiopsis sp. YSL2 TaxID=2939492 RepID=UPI0026F45717|nr:helix-turn-helix transcriptional regulator [Nocardiopsis sp. YSL2]